MSDSQQALIKNVHNLLFENLLMLLRNNGGNCQNLTLFNNEKIHLTILII